jgi:hypothetical protein
MRHVAGETRVRLKNEYRATPDVWGRVDEEWKHVADGLEWIAQSAEHDGYTCAPSEEDEAARRLQVSVCVVGALSGGEIESASPDDEPRWSVLSAGRGSVRGRDRGCCEFRLGMSAVSSHQSKPLISLALDESHGLFGRRTIMALRTKRRQLHLLGAEGAMEVLTDDYRIERDDGRNHNSHAPGAPPAG